MFFAVLQTKLELLWQFLTPESNANSAASMRIDRETLGEMKQGFAIACMRIALLVDTEVSTVVERAEGAGILLSAPNGKGEDAEVAWMKQLARLRAAGGWVHRCSGERGHTQLSFDRVRRVCVGAEECMCESLVGGCSWLQALARAALIARRVPVVC